MALSERSAGILLHPTSLPGPYGIGELGTAAFGFIDYLCQSEMTRWQILPLGPTGYADSPYASLSTFAGNPLLISMDQIVADGWLHPDELRAPDFGDPSSVNFGAVMAWKLPLLEMAARRFLHRPTGVPDSAYQTFCESQSFWLDDYALFASLKQHYDQLAMESGNADSSWNTAWNREHARREPTAMIRWRDANAESLEIRKVWQYWFFDHWQRIKRYANQKGIRIIGDIPIFVAQDSADVWANPSFFQLQPDGSPRFIAGVPPDYFSKTGQRWGNPLYDWEALRQSKFSWWIRRFRATCDLVDLVRVDHFRGFDACWSIPAGHKDAVEGKWVKVPGKDLFAEVHRQLGPLPLIAEDLGVITPEVDELRDSNGFPGMKILQFAFDSREDRSRFFLPHYHIPNCVVYTGTHDNQPVRGWYDTRNEDERRAFADYVGYPVQEIGWDFIRLAFSSIANTAIVPMQDILGLGDEARMNEPSTMGKNWRWRMTDDYRQGDSAGRLSHLARIYHRSPHHADRETYSRLTGNLPVQSGP